MEIPRHWRLKKQRYGLVGEVCPHCDHKIFPPRDVCPHCGDEEKSSNISNSQGEVCSYTTDVDGVTTIALIKLSEGTTVTARLIDNDQHQVKVGMPVEIVPKSFTDNRNQTGAIIYSYLFRPVTAL